MGNIENCVLESEKKTKVNIIKTSSELLMLTFLETCFYTFIVELSENTKLSSFVLFF